MFRASPIHFGHLRRRISECGNEPGVYRMLGGGGEVLYVGKSIRLRTRLLSYLRADRGEKAWEIAAAARDVAWEYTPDEFGALLVEFRLIRRLRPLFNVEHRRERAVCFLKVTREPAPRLVATKSVSNDGAAYYGPFLGLGRLGMAARELTNLLGLRDCPARTPLRFADQADLFGIDYPPLCPRAELACCVAPCAGGSTERGYAERVRLLHSFLDGRTDRPVEILRERMRGAATRLDFEYAAELRDRIRDLEGVRDSLLRIRSLLSELTGAYSPRGGPDGAPVYALRCGQVVSVVRSVEGRGAAEPLADAARLAALAPEPDFARLNPDAVAEILLVARWFRRRPEERARLHGRAAADEAAGA